MSGSILMEPNGSHLLINGSLFRDSDLSAPILAANSSLNAYGGSFVGTSFPTTGQIS